MEAAFQLFLNKNSQKFLKVAKNDAATQFSSKNTCVLQLLFQLLLN